eukprot:5402349-Pyramimonas_sp.AAC.1
MAQQRCICGDTSDLPGSTSQANIEQTTSFKTSAIHWARHWPTGNATPGAQCASSTWENAAKTPRLPKVRVNSGATWPV